MKKTILILILSLAIMPSSQAQYSFDIRNAFHSFFSVITSVVPRDGLYYCTGPCWDSINYAGNNEAYQIYGVRFAILDSLGNILRDTVYQQNGKMLEPWANTLISTTDKGFLLASFDADSIYNDIMILHLDSSGHMLWYKEYPQPFCTNENFYDVTDFKPIGNGQWLTLATVACYYNWGNPLGNTQADIVLTKLDSNFNIIWTKKYGDSVLQDVANKIIIEPDGYVIGGSSNSQYDDQSNYSEQAEMIKTDTAGNQLWIWKSNPHPLTGGPVDMIRTMDGSYVYCGYGNGHQYFDGPDVSFIFEGWIEKLDSNRNVMWNDTLAVFGGELTVLKQLPNSDIVAAGMIAGGFNIADSGGLSYGALIKYSNSGDIIWERKYSVPNDTFQYTIFDMKQTPDGGFILSGDAVDYNADGVPPLERGWVVKVDSNGCQGPNDPQCWPTSVPKVQQTADIKVYPNPANNILNITYRLLNNEDATLQITDMLGRVIQTTPLNKNTTRTTINCATWPTGVYVYKAIQGGMMIGDGKIVKE